MDARKAWLRALELTAPIGRDPTLTFPVLIDRLAERFEGALALLSERESWSYRDLAARANRYAHWAHEQGLGHGSTIALIMANAPEYLAIWLGVTRIGGVVALINTHLVGESLLHAITTVAPSHIVIGAMLADATRSALSRIARPITCWVSGGSAPGLRPLDPEIERLSGDPLPEQKHAITSIEDRALLIYTSGTTGLPKAAPVSHLRLLQWTHWFAGLMDTGPGDRLYNCLPMYHAIGGVAATGALLIGGGSVLLKPRFSLATFWDEVIENDCTLFQYIGELCRYLVSAQTHPRERRHQLRLCCGNGLDVEVWRRFQERFRIPHILEFYAATEGVFSLYNCEGKPGAIGKVPGFLAHRFPVALIRLDLETGVPLRDGDGRCIRCGTGEAGEAIGRVGDANAPGGRFEGYTDREASEHKLLHDVFAPGDTWYRTGDLMRQDTEGYFYFVDRMGDSFRWKGENVSASEAAAALAACPGVVEAVVYGVPVPGTEGRAGMAAIIVSAGFDLDRFHRDVAGLLPDYAQPLFLRICADLEMTATFRPRKQDLLRVGFDPAATSDPLYFNDRICAAFVPLDRTLYQRIVNHELRV